MNCWATTGMTAAWAILIASRCGSKECGFGGVECSRRSGHPSSREWLAGGHVKRETSIVDEECGRIIAVRQRYDSGGVA